MYEQVKAKRYTSVKSLVNEILRTMPDEYPTSFARYVAEGMITDGKAEIQQTTKRTFR